MPAIDLVAAAAKVTETTLKFTACCLTYSLLSVSLLSARRHADDSLDRGCAISLVRSRLRG